MSNTNRHRARSSAASRRELRALLHNPPPATGLSEPGPEWYRVYTRRICRYLLRSLDDSEMRAWEVAFTALHEMVACAWASRPHDAVGLGDVEAWSQVSAEEHLAVAQVLTMMPESIDVSVFVPHMRGFLRQVVSEGGIDPRDAERLDHEYAMFDPTELPRAVA